MLGWAEPDTYICIFFLPVCSFALLLLESSGRAYAYAAEMTLQTESTSWTGAITPRKSEVCQVEFRWGEKKTSVILGAVVVLRGEWAADLNGSILAPRAPWILWQLLWHSSESRCNCLNRHVYGNATSQPEASQGGKAGPAGAQVHAVYLSDQKGWRQIHPFPDLI